MTFQLIVTVIFALIAYGCYASAKRLFSSDAFYAVLLAPLSVFGCFASGAMALIGVVGCLLIVFGFATVS